MTFEKCYDIKSQGSNPISLQEEGNLETNLASSDDTIFGVLQDFVKMT